MHQDAHAQGSHYLLIVSCTNMIPSRRRQAQPFRLMHHDSSPCTRNYNLIVPCETSPSNVRCESGPYLVMRTPPFLCRAPPLLYHSSGPVITLCGKAKREMATEIAVLVGGRIPPHKNIMRGVHSFQVCGARIHGRLQLHPLNMLVG